MAKIPLLSCWISFFIVACTTTLSLMAGIEKQTQNYYLGRYLNKTFFLRAPLYDSFQIIDVREKIRIDPSSQVGTLIFKVGEQVRVIGIEFKQRSIRFRVVALEGRPEGMVLFRFARPLEQLFDQKDMFEEALTFAFTEGVSYRDIDAAKIAFIENRHEEIIHKFVAETGTTRGFVVKKLTDKNAEYQKAIKNARELEKTVIRFEKRMEKSSKELDFQRSRYRELAQHLEKVTIDLGVEKEERLQALGQLEEGRKSAQKIQVELNQLRKAQGVYEQQVNDLVASFDFQEGNGEEVESKVASIGSFVSQLQMDQSKLSNQLTELRSQVSALQNNNKALDQDLSLVRNENKRLLSRLRVLTSDKKSINFQYLEMREQKEILEKADELSEAIKVGPLVDMEVEEQGLTAPIFLESRLLGTVNIMPPDYVGNRSKVEVSLVSPDTVKFSDRERKLHSDLGDEIRVEVAWVASKDLAVELVEGEGSRILKRREKAFWEWEFKGAISKSQTTTFKIDLIDRNSQKIPLLRQQFVVHPASPWNWILRIFSLPSLFVGLIVGGVAMKVLNYLRRAGKTIPGSHAVGHIVEKKL